MIFLSRKLHISAGVSFALAGHMGAGLSSRQTKQEGQACSDLQSLETVGCGLQRYTGNASMVSGKAEALSAGYTI